MTTSMTASTPPMISTPVLIIGGGPVGLATAMELAHHGVDCVVVEPRTEVSHTRPRAKTVSARTMELFRRWAFADEVRKRAPIRVDWSSDIAFCTTATGREITRMSGVLGLDLAGSDLAAEPGQQVGQPVVEQALRDALGDSPRVQFLTGLRAVRIGQDDGGVRGELEDAAGEPVSFTAEYVIGADGARSLVRAAMGSVYVGGNAGRPNLSVVFRCRGLAERLVGAPALHYWVLNPAAPGVVGPLDTADTWWAISTGRPDDDQDADPVEIVRGLIGRHVDVEVLGIDPWQARSLLVDRYRAGRLFLVGDAAHQNPPWGGHGFNTGIGDAVNLGWKLAAVLRGWAPPDLLDSYESERRPVAAQTIEIAAANTAALPTDLAVAAVHDDPVAAAALAERVQASKHREFYCTGLVLGYAYGPGTGTQTNDGTDFTPRTVPGNRLPHRWVRPGQSVYDLLGPGLTVIGEAAAARPLLAAAADRRVPLALVEDVGVPTREAFGAELVLVRPDQHIAWSADHVEVADAGDVLTRAISGFAAPATTSESAGP